jgi:site-specific recombinase XerC
MVCRSGRWTTCDRPIRGLTAYTLTVGQLGEHLADTSADLPTTHDLRREHIEDFLNALSKQGLAAATLSRLESAHRRVVVRTVGVTSCRPDVPTALPWPVP